MALCKALLERPDLLLLDEPTNHLDAETIDWLEVQLRDYPGTVIVVTHDRYFLDNITKWILELEGGRGIPWEGNYSSWLEQKLTKLTADEKKDSPRHRALSHELAWIRMSNQDKHELSRARLGQYEQLIAREAAPWPAEDSAVIQIAPGPELGDQVIEFRNVAKKYGDTTLFHDLNFMVPKGRRRRHRRPQRHRQNHAAQNARGTGPARRGRRSSSARPCRSPTPARSATCSKAGAA